MKFKIIKTHVTLFYAISEEVIEMRWIYNGHYASSIHPPEVRWKDLLWHARLLKKEFKIYLDSYKNHGQGD